MTCHSFKSSDSDGCNDDDDNDDDFVVPINTLQLRHWSVSMGQLSDKQFLDKNILLLIKIEI